jgi:3-oxoadipate enol-lactonase
MQTIVPVGADKVWAEDSGGDSPVLVLMHEHVGDSRMWDPIWPALTAAFRVIRYDVRGFGRSPAATESYSLLGDLRVVLDHFGIERAHFAGCSGGGGIIVDLALAEPDRVRSLILLCPGISGYDWPAEPEADAEFERMAAAGDEDGMVELTIRICGKSGPDALVSEMARSSVRAWPSAELVVPDEPAFARLGEICAPTVIMVGDLDRAALIDSNEQAAARIPGCELIRMPGVDHFPTVREPRLILDTILSHCER